MGVAVWSPPLDKHYNSLKGEDFIEQFVREFGYYQLKYTYGDGLKQENTNEEDKIKNGGMNLLFHAFNGELREIKMSLANGIDLNFKDYDDRTALHLACAEGHQRIVEYLLKHGADKEAKDLHGQTSYDVA